MKNASIFAIYLFFSAFSLFFSSCAKNEMLNLMILPATGRFFLFLMVKKTIAKSDPEQWK